MANHLAAETSPYLLQHAQNPVDWYPWGPEALKKAETEDKPIFLSIGYSACHWCHVMERESFSDAETAARLNEHFVCIKVDREERPDLDAVYMQAVTAMTGRGGWPLSVWLTPQGTPFYGGTYFPDSPRFGMASFRQVILALDEAWRNRRQDIQQAASTLLAGLTQEQASGTAGAETVHEEARGRLADSFDPAHGGWGDAPKFPQPMVLEYLLMWLSSTSDPVPDIKDEVDRTLEAMAFGGIYDQLRGGFHRYSTDDRWLVPHFEKMLYDNAQLARCYVHAWQLLGPDLYRRIAEETLEYLIAEMKHPEGGFYSSQDADSEGEEGRFFLWTVDEMEGILDADLARLARETFGMTPNGNFEGSNILWMAAPPGDPSATARLETVRDQLLAVREQRVHPRRDDKILASWNGLALAAFADAGRALDSVRFRDIAVTLGEFLAREMISPEFRTCRSWKDGRRTGMGFLEDYACLAEGFMALYRATFDERWFEQAHGLTRSMIAGFGRDGGGFYDTSAEHESLVVRPRSLQDSPTPSGNSLAATVLLRMAALTGEGRYWDLATETLRQAAPPAGRAPSVFGQWLSAHYLADVGITEVAVVGDLNGPDAVAMTSVLARTYLPRVVVAARRGETPSSIAVLDGREPPAGVEAAAWVCRGQVCSTAIADPAELLERLGPPRPASPAA
jgi:uncharacterized protein YyaL (SSP411 family)